MLQRRPLESQVHNCRQSYKTLGHNDLWDSVVYMIMLEATILKELHKIIVYTSISILTMTILIYDSIISIVYCKLGSDLIRQFLSGLAGNGW